MFRYLEPPTRYGTQMIGFIFGLILVFAYLGTAGTGFENDGSIFSSGLPGAFIFILILAIVGILIIPRTIGVAFTPMSFVTPIAFVLGWVQHGFLFGLGMLGLGVAAWLTTVLIGILRPEST